MSFAEDYIEVRDRIIAFKEKHPEGSLQAEIHTLTDSLVVMRASAFRTPDDPRPGVGWSSLEIPGKTSFTRGAEIENCETSAWGRAIAALGFEVKRSIATRDEVRNKESQRADTAAPKPQQKPAANSAPAADNWTSGAAIFLTTAKARLHVERDAVLRALAVANEDELIAKAKAAGGWNPLAEQLKASGLEVPVAQ